MVKIFLLAAVLLFGVNICQGQVDQTSGQKLNVLFIAVDDLRPELNCFGASHVKSPNLDRLAEKSTVFTRAYCQQAVCAPSRNSIMTGLRPDAMGIYDLYTFFRTKTPEVVTLPQHFKQYGYYTERVGKIYHTGHGNKDDDLSWTQPAATLLRPAPISRDDTMGLESDFPSIDGLKLPFHISKEKDQNMSDVIATDYAIKRISELKDSAFFFAVGYVKPHLPFVAPKKYWDLYDPAEISIPKREVPEGMPDVALHQFGELRKYHGVPKEGHLDDELSRNLIHGYYAATSMIDAQIGRLIEALKENNLEKNTIIVVWGDHGWKLGEYGGWCKHTNFELDTNVPLIIFDPTHPVGQYTTSLAELVDLYPTLCEMNGLPLPSHLEGQSLKPILEDPKATVNNVALSQYPRGKSLGYDRKNQWMGYSLHYGTYRFTRWQEYENPGKILAFELYDHSNGPLAQINLANQPEHQGLVEEMNALMSAELAKYELLRSHPGK